MPSFARKLTQIKLTAGSENLRRFQDYAAAQQKIDFWPLHCHMAGIEALGSVNW
jgi:hypothetical protein